MDDMMKALNDAGDPNEFRPSGFGRYYHLLDTGRAFYAYGGHISINADLNTGYGYDGDLPDTIAIEKTQDIDFDNPEFTPVEWLEICDVMIYRWKRLREQYSGILKEDEDGEER